MARRVLPVRLRRRLDWLDRLSRGLFPLPKLRLEPGDTIPAPSPYASLIQRGNPLEILGEKYGPTKRHHDYLKYYWMHLRDVRHEVRSVLEIGVQSDRSIRMWEEFFPNAIIYGIDIDPACEAHTGGRRQVFIGDQSDTKFLDAVIDATGGGFDVVIDDGSHVVEHQLTSFRHLFPRLSQHGLYVVEDTGPGVGDQSLVTVRALQQLIPSILYWPDGFPGEDWRYLVQFDDAAEWQDRNIAGIAFYRWIVFVMRGRNPDDNPHLIRPDRA